MSLLERIHSPADVKALTRPELDRLAAEIRHVIIQTVARRAGHLAPNLGVVELTLALHRVFDSPRDKIIWDVGHQSYPHKLVTGRFEQFDTLRSLGGIRGYPSREESEHDPFGTCHGSTSISAALGFVVARDLKGQNFHVVAVIGDGALTGGMAFEGLNNAGELGRKLLVILNDNEWSISPNVGAIARYLTRLTTHRFYRQFERDVYELLGRVPKLGTPDCNLMDPAQNAECGRMDNQNFGKETFTRLFDPDFINGWGKRGSNWELGVSLQHELQPRIGISVGYFRRTFDNFYTADNVLTTAADYTPFSIPIPVDSRLPGGGGGTVSGLYNLVPEKVGQEQQLAQLASNFGDQIENWHGVDFGVNARLRNGIIAQAGTSTGRRLQDNCAIRSVLPETYSWDNVVATQTTRVTNLHASTATAGLQNYSCRVVEPFRTSFRGLATYTVPKVEIQVSGTWRSDPGDEQRADYVVTSAVARPSLGRDLSSGNVTVNLVPRGTLFGPRINNIDVRVAKILRYGRTRTQVGFDIYNLTNNDTPTMFNNAYSPTGAWLTPTQILPARYVRLNAQVDF